MEDMRRCAEACRSFSHEAETKGRTTLTGIGRRRLLVLRRFGRDYGQPGGVLSELSEGKRAEWGEDLIAGAGAEITHAFIAY